MGQQSGIGLAGEPILGPVLAERGAVGRAAKVGLEDVSEGLLVHALHKIALRWSFVRHDGFEWQEVVVENLARPLLVRRASLRVVDDVVQWDVVEKLADQGRGTDKRGQVRGSSRVDGRCQTNAEAGLGGANWEA